jgi:hypothetical protein
MGYNGGILDIFLKNVRRFIYQAAGAAGALYIV